MRRVISRKRLGGWGWLEDAENRGCGESWNNEDGECSSGNALGQGLALALQQVVAGLGALELALHQPQRLARGEDGLSRLRVVSVGVLHGVMCLGTVVPRCRT